MEHLSKEATTLFDSIASEYGISDPAGCHLLLTACEAMDRMRHCQQSILELGEVIADRYGQLKPHPLLSSERDSRAAMVSALKSLNLDLEPLKEMGRPSQVYGVSLAK